MNLRHNEGQKPDWSRDYNFGRKQLLPGQLAKETELSRQSLQGNEILDCTNQIFYQLLVINNDERGLAWFIVYRGDEMVYLGQYQSLHKKTLRFKFID